jgi:hypothetical protein
MKRSRADLKREMLAKAEKAIDQFLDWAEGHERPTLTEIEDQVLRARKHIGTGMAEGVIGAQEAVRPEKKPECPNCKRPMHRKGAKRTRVESRVGAMGLEREHYYCEHCGSSVFPPGSATEIV